MEVLPKKVGSFDSIGHFIAGSAIFAGATLLGSSMGNLGGALGSFIGAWVGSKYVVRGNFEKGVLMAFGVLNAIDYVMDALIPTQRGVSA